MENAIMYMGFGAAGLAIVIAIMNRLMGKIHVPKQTSAGSQCRAIPGNQKQCNKRGWRAPADHYFDANDELYTDAGDLIMDLSMAAVLCGEVLEPGQATFESPVEAPEDSVIGAEAVGLETIASYPVESEVASHSDFGSLQTSASSESKSWAGSGGGGDAGGCDSSGDDGGGDD